MGHVYLIRMGDTNYFKVGISRDVNDRLAGLQTATPFALTLVDYAEQDNPLGVERDIHKALRQCQVRNEWFQCDESYILQIFRDFNMMASIDSAFDNVPESAPSAPGVLGDVADDTALVQAFLEVGDQHTAIRKLLERGRSANTIAAILGGNRNNALETIRRIKTELLQETSL